MLVKREGRPTLSEDQGDTLLAVSVCGLGDGDRYFPVALFFCVLFISSSILDMTVNIGHFKIHPGSMHSLIFSVMFTIVRGLTALSIRKKKIIESFCAGLSSVYNT